jgi:hypothetical protein
MCCDSWVDNKNVSECKNSKSEWPLYLVAAISFVHTSGCEKTMPPRSSLRGPLPAVLLSSCVVGIINIIHGIRERSLADVVAAVLIWGVIAPILSFRLLKSSHDDANRPESRP